jgi:hypothetical protein
MAGNDVDDKTIGGPRIPWWIATLALIAIAAKANDTAFWVGTRDNRVLVVMARDNRTERQRQLGVPGSHGIAEVHGGQRATISGVIERAPDAEGMTNWDLTAADKSELADRRIYIRAREVKIIG